MPRYRLRMLVLAVVPAMAAPYASGQAPSSPDRPATARSGFKVVYWYLRSDPLHTFHFQVYNLDQGQYTPAVDAWLTMMQTHYPQYRAYVKDVAQESTLAASILDEHRITGGPSTGAGIRDLGGLGPINITGGYSRGYYGIPEAGAMTQTIPRSVWGRMLPGALYPSTLGPAPGSGAGQSLAPTYLSPFPYPYPRPHP